jgi:ABC-2 type transport system ATP-binding protein
MIEAIELTKRYDDGTLALDRLALKILPGEIYCLLGANGAGKTTTINLFLDFIAPSSGRALINGIEVFRDPLQAKKHVAYLSESVMLYPNFTALQNLDFFARIGGRSDLGEEDYTRILSQVGLPAAAFKRRVGEFSKGMRQKVGIAIAISKNAPALFLDEPTSGLDPKAAAEFSELLVELRAEGRAILMSTHDLFHARELADRVGIMKLGRKVAELTRESLEHRNLQQLYLDYMRDEETGPQPLQSAQRGS